MDTLMTITLVGTSCPTWEAKATLRDQEAK